MRKTIRMTLSVLLTILLILSVMPLTVFAADTNGTCGSGVSWEYSDGTLTITSSKSGGGTMDNYSASNDPPWVDYKDDITSITVKGVKKIGNYAFYGMSKLSSVEFPKTKDDDGNVTGNNVLEQIGTYVFSFCTSLTEMTLPENLDSIGQHCFKDSGITKLIFTRNKLSSAGSGTRQAFRSLKGAEIYVPEGFQLAGKTADPSKWNAEPFYKNYVSYTDSSKASVYWLDDDGSVLSSEAVDAGTTPSYDDDLEEKDDGSVFDCWDPEPSAVSANTINKYTAVYSLPKYTVTWANWDGTVLAADTVEQGTTPEYSGKTPLREPDDDLQEGYHYAFSGWSPEVTAATENVTYTAQYTQTPNDPIDYVNANGKAQPSLTDYRFIVDSTNPSYSATLSDSDKSWWVVKSYVDEQTGTTVDSFTINDRIVIDGDINLLLCDGATLNAAKGITVNSGNSLTIWQQEEGTGELMIDDVAENHAGIGSTYDMDNNTGTDSGNITINGGKITVTGGKHGAGIGGGYKGSGTVTINGGEITATGGGMSGAGIGGGYDGSADVEITGGKVKAVGASYASGIGYGNHTISTEGRLKISGGEVDVTNGIGYYSPDNETDFAINLTWTDETKDTMSVTSDSYNGTVTLEKKFKAMDGNDPLIFAAGTLENNSTIAGLTLTPATATSWQVLKYLLNNAVNDSTITLDQDCVAGADDSYLFVPSGKTVTLDLNGYTINRDLSSGIYGGEVIMNNGTLTITDSSANQSGVIKGGYNNVDGGGAIYNSGNLTINGGTFRENMSSLGGAIRNLGALTINGGIFTENTVYQYSKSVDPCGGAIYNEGTLNLNGGTITENSCSTAYGGGIFTNTHGSLNISGSPIVSGNTAKSEDNDIYLIDNQIINVTGTLDANAKIGIREKSPDTETAFTTGLSGNGNASNFFSNHAGYRVTLNEDNEAHLIDGKYSISIDEDIKYGTVTADPESAYKDETVNLTATPDDECGSVKGVYVNDGEVEVTDNGNGTYSFAMPADDVIVTAEFNRAPVSYVDANGTQQEAITDYNVVTADTLTMTDGWYIVNDTVTNNNRISVSGDANLLLCDGAELTATKGIKVQWKNPSGTLTIWQQENGTGTLTATATDSGYAGIGGNSQRTSGNITINGGSITAQGADNGAGIGSGYKQPTRPITINGGAVTATGGSNAAGIGGGCQGLARVFIYGGEINATGGTKGAGIGAGTGTSYVNGKTIEITISGGTVTATGGDNASAIGCGYNNSNGSSAITINGGQITANAGSSGYGVNSNISSSNEITLNWTDDTKADMSLASDSYNGTVKLNKPFKDKDTGTYFEVTDQADNSELAGTTLVPINDSNVELVGHSISLDGDIGVNFYMELSDSVIAHKNTAYMHFTIPKNGDPDTKDVYVKDAKTETVGGKTYYVFKCNVAAKEMDSNITATLIDGDYTSETYTYSVRQYADYLLDHLEVEEYAKAATLVRAMLTYGDNAEYYFDKTGTKPADIKVDIPEYTSTVHDTLPSYAEFTGATLSLKSQTTLSLYFESEQKIDLSCEGQTVEVQNSGSEYVIRIRGIAAADLNESFTVKVDGADAVTYSPLTYCYKAQQTSSNKKLVNTVKALYLYWVEADEYFMQGG